MRSVSLSLPSVAARAFWLAVTVGEPLTISAARAQIDTEEAGRAIQAATEALSQCEVSTAYALAASARPAHEIAQASQQACRGQIAVLRRALVESGMEGSVADGAIGYEESQTEPKLIAVIEQWQKSALGRGAGAHGRGFESP
jgi:hypothetical protein